MKNILKHAVAVSALTIALAGCAGSETGTSGQDGGARGPNAPASSSDKSDSKSVVMELIQFKPDSLEVAAGTTVSWTQKDAGAHTVTSGTVQEEGGGVSQKPDGKFDSGELASGETFKHEFSEPGVYSYFCSIHPATMRGEVKVS